ncbi:zona pellucida sperm-binding protein 3-like [Gouania willdenowi]|uniref:zona pellucida sperm-binding protein 3-like n=1 Tax=Gouania willdenowi TaxID=441366 RepID=UPI001055F373|nr:zona pellucida sperm-binding protein 3-like [Gouania willdenowi]
MDHIWQRLVSLLILVFGSVSAFTESRLLSSGGNPLVPDRHYSRAPWAPEKQHQAAESREEPRPIEVKCHPDAMEVVVQADMFLSGIHVDGRHLRLGSEGLRGGCGAEQSGDKEFTLSSHLMDCGMKLSSTEETIIYSTVLVYSPEPSSSSLIRLDGATIPLECHYEKKYSLDGVSVEPTWESFVSTLSGDDELVFAMRLMSDDWQYERGSNAYFLGDLFHIEVSVIIANHMPLRVYVDSCVATATSDAEAPIRYNFIENHGCLSDSYMTNSNSRFLPRVEDYKLRFELEAFRFYQEFQNEVYITCAVKAVPVTMTVGSQNKACSLVENGWQSVDGNNQACRSCGDSHLHEEYLFSKVPQTTARPITNLQSSMLNRPGQHPATYVRYRPGIQQNEHEQITKLSPKFMKRETDNQASSS